MLVVTSDQLEGLLAALECSLATSGEFGGTVNVRNLGRGWHCLYVRVCRGANPQCFPEKKSHRECLRVS
jgi:hypothetical protein